MQLFQKFILALAISISTFNIADARVEAVIGSLPLNKNPNLAILLPETENSEVLISRQQYLISYNKYRRAPNWVAWKIEANQLGSIGRSNKFQQDSELENYLTKSGGGFHAVNATDYTRSCFDRGHQIPSGDRTDTKENNEATFNMSNMIPQTPFLNRGMWEHLESYTRSLVLEQGKKVFIIAGPIYDANFGNIGPNKDIPVPSKEFKIIFILEPNQTVADIHQNTPMIAVIMPNTLKNGQAPVPSTPNCGGSATDSLGSKEDWKQYQTSLTEIENKSNLVFHNFSFAMTP